MVDIEVDPSIVGVVYTAKEVPFFVAFINALTPMKKGFMVFGPLTT